MLLEYLTNFKILSNRRDLNNLKIFSNLKLLFNNVIDGRMDNKSIIAIGVSGYSINLLSLLLSLSATNHRKI